MKPCAVEHALQFLIRSISFYLSASASVHHKPFRLCLRGIGLEVLQF